MARSGANINSGPRPEIIIDRKAISDAAADKTIAATSKSCQVLTDRVRRCGELRAELAGPATFQASDRVSAE